MTTAQVVETSVTVNNNSPIQDYVHPDDETQPTFIYSLFPWWRRFFNKTENLPRTQTFLSLDESLRAKEGGKEKTGLSSFSFPWFFGLRHQSLAFRAWLSVKNE